MSIETLYIPFKNTDVFIKQGDTIQDVIFEDTDFDFTGAVIKMQLYKNGIAKVLDVSTIDGGITIIDSHSFKINKIEAENNNLPAGILLGDLQVKFSNGDTKTLVNVEYTILKQSTL